jgi:hypothetical protein
MSVYTFPVVTVRRRKAGPCPVCGRTVQRSRTFEQTVNPFNRKPNGDVKTSTEVREDVTAEADSWVPDFTHAACAPGAR